MKLFLKLSALGILALSLTGCLPEADKTPDKTVVTPEFEAIPGVVVEEEPMPWAREIIKDEAGEIISSGENLWPNRDENSDSRS